MENEKYGIELEAKTNAFIKGIKEASKYVKAFSEGVKESFNEQVNKSFNDFKDMKDKMFGKNQKIETPEIKGGYQKQIEYVKNQLKDIEEQKKKAFKLVPISNTEQNMTKLNDYKKTLEDLDSVIKEQQDINAKMGIPDNKSKIIESLMNDKAKYEKAINEMVKVEPDTEKINELEVQYEALENKLLRLENKQEEYNDSLEEMGDDGKKSTSILGNLFDNSIRKIKRFTYYLLGARSVFSLFMKYQGIYYQYNEQMQYQTELSQNAIALSLAPAFEFLGNVIAYASIGIAKFIELLTGVNILSKVSTKGIRDYNKSLKETQSLLSGVDEITNLTLPSGTGLASQYQALDDFKKKIAEVEKWFNENTWIKAIADGIKGVYDFVKDNWDIFKYVFGAVAIMTGINFVMKATGISSIIGSLASVGGIATAGTGLAGLAGLLAFIAGIGTIAIALDMNVRYNEIKESEGKVKDLRKNFDSINDSIREDLNILSGLNKGSDKYKKKVQEINTKWDSVNSTIQLGEEDILNNTKQVEGLATLISNMLDDDYYTKTLNISKKIGLERAEEKSKSFWDHLLGNFRDADAIKEANISKLLNDFDNIEHKANLTLGDVGKAGVNSIQSIINKVNELTKKNYKIKLTTEILATVGKGVTSGALALSEAVTKAIRGYANGLDYVPYDEYPAVLHKGEAVVPAKYNPTIHSQGNEYTNSLLETLIIKVDDLSKRPNEFIIDGQKFAETTYPLYENARSRNNYIEGVVR